MKHHIPSIAIGAALFALGDLGCNSGDSGPLSSVDSLVILQRPRRNDTGDIFQYTSYVPGARIVKLQPPTADGTLTTLCCDRAGAEFARVDISGYDLSFDAKSIVFSAKLGPDPMRYELFLLQLADGSVTPLVSDPQRDFVSPIFLPDDYIMFTSNAVVEAGAPQHRDEYERGVTTQLGRVKIDGSMLDLGPRNLSHRTAPSLASDGRVIFTQWDHLGTENSGHLMFVNQDMQELREGFGKESKGASNSTLKAHEISPGRYIAIATARNRTLNAGALIDIRLGMVESRGGVVSAPTLQSEANSTYVPLSPNVPVSNMPAADTVGRYYDAFPLNARDKPDLLVSWSDGPVESGELAKAQLTANFGVYLYNSDRQQRRPILDDPEMWDLFARPLATRSAPPVVSSASGGPSAAPALIGSLDAYDSSLHQFKAGEIYGVRVMEGFSSEEGFPEMFGTTMFEGHANLGVAPVNGLGQWSAKIPANVPVHLQTIDHFGMSLFNEPVWFSARPGESRVCGGCHENRTKTTVPPPGLLDTFAAGATRMFDATPRAQRLNTAPAGVTDIVGVGWDTQLQSIFNAKCVSCHGDDNKAGLAGYTITDPETKTTLTWTFNLSGDKVPDALATVAGAGAFSKSYFSMAGPDMEAVETSKLMIAGNFKVYLNPTDARGSLAIQKLNPFQIFPSPDTAVRAFATAPHLVAQGAAADLTAKEFYLLVLAADMGVNYYARENNPHLSIY